MPPLDEDLQMRSIDVDGKERSFWIPETRPRGAVRVVFAFHDRGETGLKLARRTRLYRAALAAGVNIVFPDALERVWDDHGSGRRDGADDDLFFSTMLDHLHRRGEFGDAAPILTGFGETGAAFAERLAREGVHPVAGVLLIGGTARDASRALTPQPIVPTPLLLVDPPAGGRRRPGLRARLALNQVRGHALVRPDDLLRDWREVNRPAGILTAQVDGDEDPWPLIERLLD